MTHTEDRMARLAFALLVEPGNAEVGASIRRNGVQAALAGLLTGGISDPLAGAVSARLAAAGAAPTRAGIAALAESAVIRAERLGTRIVTPEDDEWPAQVEDLVHISRQGGHPIDRDTYPPNCLWVRGQCALGEALERSVAIVGARAATEYGAHVASDLGYELAIRDWSVVSGGAFGIDAAAHRGALTAGGLTVAVLACGVDRPYPVAHTSLFERIAEEGLLISEWPPGSAPHRMRFLTRNRMIAAATRGTVVVEAGLRSGARQTLGRARRLGRPAMVVPGPVTSAMSAGCHVELRGVDSRLVTTAEEIIEEVGQIGELALVPRGPQHPADLLDPLAARLLDAVQPRRARTAEEIAAVVGVSGTEARRGLPALVDAGLVVATDNGYRLAPAKRT